MLEKLDFSKLTFTHILAILAIIIAILIPTIILPFFAHQDTINYLKTQFPTAQNYEKTGQYDKAIEIYNKCLERVTREKYPYEFAVIKIMIGRNLGLLSEKSDQDNKKLDLINSRDSYNEALTIVNSDEYPYEFAEANIGLGSDYADLAAISDQKENLQKSIESFNSTLNIVIENPTPSRTGILLQINSSEGIAYISPYEWITKKPDFIRVSMPPLVYPMILQNIAVDYQNLAILENNEDYNNKSRELFEKALKYVSKDKSPDDYAQIQFNYGNVAIGLENKLKAFNESQSIYTREKNSYLYAEIQHNIGSAYFHENPNDPVYIEKSITFFESALTIFTNQTHPLEFAKTQKSLGDSYARLGLFKDKEKNFEIAKNAYISVLQIKTPEQFPIDYADTQNAIAVLYTTLGDVKTNQTNRLLAKKAFQEAFSIYKNYPTYNKTVASNYAIFVNLTS